MPIRRSGVGYADFSGGDLNFAIGCTPVSPGCEHCYARALIERSGRDFSEITLYPEKLTRLRTARFDERATPFRRGPGSRPLAFPVDLGDLFHPKIPEPFIAKALGIMTRRHDVDWLVLTKRANRLMELSRLWLGRHGWTWPANIWPGVSVESNHYLWRVNRLMNVEAAARWVSMEPLLEDIEQPYYHLLNLVDWLVVGGESGPNRRPFDKAWARDLYHFAAPPFFFKQGSAYRPGQDHLLDGKVVQNFPNVSPPAPTGQMALFT